MPKIESHANDYASLKGYIRPEDVALAPYPPQTAEDVALYQAAHAMVSERHDKYDLVQVMYAVLHRENASMHAAGRVVKAIVEYEVSNLGAGYSAETRTNGVGVVYRVSFKDKSTGKTLGLERAFSALSLKSMDSNIIASAVASSVAYFVRSVEKEIGIQKGTW